MFPIVLRASFAIVAIVDIVVGLNNRRHNVVGVQLIARFDSFIQALLILMARIDQVAFVVEFDALFSLLVETNDNHKYLLNRYLVAFLRN